MCAYIFIIIWLNKKIIFIKQFSKYNWENVLSCEIKNLNLNLSLDFFSFILTYRL
jgi:hypothetical protein